MIFRSNSKLNITQLLSLMVISSKTSTVKDRLKSFVRKRKHQYNYRRLEMDKDGAPKKRSFVKVFANILQRFIVVIARFLFKNVFYSERGQSMPPIKNLLLLEPATVLAMKIRTKKVITDVYSLLRLLTLNSLSYQITSVEVLKTFIERVQEVNPLLNCVVDERFSEALKEAEEADKFIASGTWTEEEIATKKPFLGVPISTKDCIKVKGMLNTSGLYHRKDIRADDHAPTIQRMVEAGAIPFALTNTSELCMWWESVNCVHGRTNNPYDTNRIVGGSSGGEGAIQASAASPFGIGSDIGGSIRMPAFFNGVFGHKPSKGVVNNDGQHPSPYSDEQSGMLSTGPICR